MTDASDVTGKTTSVPVDDDIIITFITIIIIVIAVMIAIISVLLLFCYSVNFPVSF